MRALDDCHADCRDPLLGRRPSGARSPGIGPNSCPRCPGNPRCPGKPRPCGSAAAPAAADPVLARVGTDEIHASELGEAAQSLPEELRGMPPQMLYPMLLDQLVDRHAIVLAARKQGLLDGSRGQAHHRPRHRHRAAERAADPRDRAPMLTDAAIQARYDRDYANKPGEEEVHAAPYPGRRRGARPAIIAQLKGGADFAALAKENSTDPSAKGNGGDLGFFKKGDMLPEFADAAFALKPGEITEAPVKTRFGWHVIKLLERRTAPAPKLDEQVRDEIRQAIIQEGVTRRCWRRRRPGWWSRSSTRTGRPWSSAPPAAPDVAPAPAATPAPAPAK